MSKGIRDIMAKLIRVVTVPPVMAAALILCLWLGRERLFKGAEAAISIFFLAILPLMAYPVSALVPALRKKGREGQRNMAFVMSALGYVGLWLYGALSGSGSGLMLIYGTYLFSLFILLIFNKLLGLRASGHACSVVGPMLLIMYFSGLRWALLCLPVYCASFWASLAAKRHTPGEYLLGSVSCLCALFISWLIYM